jgi:hypothetical protein
MSNLSRFCSWPGNRSNTARGFSTCANSFGCAAGSPGDTAGETASTGADGLDRGVSERRCNRILV